MERSYAFSVITAVYNAAPFLPETYESLLKQDIGFSNIQWILCDDGSKDESPAMCDGYAKQYPDNVVVIHKENGGVSSARNACIPHVRGKYVSFLDADDLLTENAMTKVAAFFEQHPETDVVSLAMEFFDGQTGDHPLNYKYQNGSRVVDLRSEPFNPQLAVTSAFVRAEALKGKTFDTNLSYAEDAKLLQSILIEKNTLGVVSDAKHLYRRRSTGELSAIQNSGNNKSWYIPYLTHFSKETLDACEERFGCIPRFVQNTVAYDLQWRIQQNKLPSAILSAEEKEEYVNLVFSLLKRIDDDILARQTSLATYQRAFLLYKKHDAAPLANTVLPIGRACVYPDSKPFILGFDQLFCEFCTVSDGFVTLECSTLMDNGFETEPPVVIAAANGRQYIGEPIERKQSVCSMGLPIADRIGYVFRIPLPNDPRADLRVAFFRQTENGNYAYKGLFLKQFFPISGKYRNAYAKIGDRILRKVKAELVFSPARGKKLSYELRFQKELFNKHSSVERHALVGRIVYTLLKPLCKKPIWLVSDRMEVAGDNGEALFRYLCTLKKKPARIYFAVSPKDPAFAELKKLGKVVKAKSARHKFLFLLCDMNISSQADDDIITQFSKYDSAYRDIQSRIKFVFLQHGVIKDDLSEWLNRYNRNAAAFVTSAKAEADSIRDGAYHYPDSAIWLTGLPRFDRLYHDEKRCITIMPTWRHMWVSHSNTVTGVRELKDGFEEGTFFRFYNALLNDPRLLEAAKKTGYEIRFMPHPLLQPHMDRFTKNDGVTFLSADTPYRKVFAESDLVLTDYSSVVFDFVYLRKPVVYTQFDRDEFYSGDHMYVPGYFDYDRDGFGEVETDYEATVDRLIEYMENGCRLKDAYRARIDGFFAFRDAENCRRVTEKLLELEARR
ncbi:MAG: CDP-glycerol glycerophosphotransferase family protein [Clostridia bacterium]|nr:CDP-glycerol glycerophosphotransferase family protein [Clostridia bacterium]